MSSGFDPSPPRRRPLNIPSTLSPLGTHPGTPSHEDDENAPLLRPGDVERAVYNATRKSFNSDWHVILVPSMFPGDPGLDLESDMMKPPPQTSSTWAKAQYYMPSLYWMPNYTLSL